MVEDYDTNLLELNPSEKRQLAQNFAFYVRNKGGKDNLIERFELPMVLEGKSNDTEFCSLWLLRGSERDEGAQQLPNGIKFQQNR